MSSKCESVKVIVRCRPMNSREYALKCKNVVQMNADMCMCSLVNPNDLSAPPKCFTFDGVYDDNSSTEQIYNEIAYSLIEGVLDGYNSTIFAYGQTGCGKSFSMQGIQEPPSQRGIIPRAFEHIFEAISLVEDYKYLVLASYLEIYNEEIRDLLSCDTKRKLELKENSDRGVYVNDLSYHAVHDVPECKKLMEQGWRNRAVGATMMNADSSRSHSIFSISVEMIPTSNILETTSIRRGKLNLVDLAGSERQAKTGATGDRLKEATKINLSLSALGNVISALVDGKAKHIPYRDSKLTRLLQDSLGGNTKTLMVACLSPADNNYIETLSTLRYANRAKNICNKPHINEDPKDTMLREYQQEIRKLKTLLENAQLLPINDDEMTFNPIIEVSNRSLVEAKKDNLYSEYEKEMTKLKRQYEDEHKSKCQMESDLRDLKRQYEQDIAMLNRQAQMNDTTVEDLIPLKSEQSVVSSVQQEIMKRLNKLQASMVGGERVNDRELKEKRLRKKKEAERRLNMLAQMLTKVDDEEGPNLVLKVYDNIQEELKVKIDLLRKYKQKVKASEREISDLQSEFENERTDYLETIRKQERQIKLLNQILDTIIPTLSNECNYSNLEKIKQDARWSDDSQCWILPELLNPTIKLPPATGIRKTEFSLTAPEKRENNGGIRNLDNNRRVSSLENLSEDSQSSQPHIKKLTPFFNVSVGILCLLKKKMFRLLNVCPICYTRCMQNVYASVFLGVHNFLSTPEEHVVINKWSRNSTGDIWSDRSTDSSPEYQNQRKYSLDQHFQKFDTENFAGNYFKPRRAAELLLQAREDATKSIATWKDSLKQTNCTSTNNDNDIGVHNGSISRIKSKWRYNGQIIKDYGFKSRNWNGQASPLAWMTGNVRMSPEMLPKKSGRVDLLPLIHERRNSKILNNF